MEFRIIQLTEAAHRHGNLNLSACGHHFFPQDVFGPPSRREGLGKQITIRPTGLNALIKTDIPTDRQTGKPRWIFRKRKWVKEFIRANLLSPAAKVRIIREGMRVYSLTPDGSSEHEVFLFNDVATEQRTPSLGSMNSPFRYAGGKFYARKLILEHIPPHDFYCEPFAGGGSIFFAKPKAKESHLNDLDKDLMLVYRTIRDRAEDLIAFLDGLPASKELHGYYKNEFKPRNLLERAGRWFYLNRTSYSGIMNMQNCYWGYGSKFSMRPENWPRAIRAASAKLQEVRLTNNSFEDAIKSAPDGAFLFIDPPYFNADQDKFYTCAFSREDHYRLARFLRHHSARLRFLLTYDDSPEIRDLYSWASATLSKTWNYCINRTDDQKNGTQRKGKRYKGQELFILNYTS
jgi:DNA adenine methylase